MKKTAALFFILCMVIQLTYAQKRTVSGTVRDKATGELMIGVTIVEKGTTNGTLTDNNGNFQISIQPESTLVISFIGMLTREIKPGKASNLSIDLESDTKQVEEVVVVGYGTQKKANLTGAVATVDVEKALVSRPITDVGRGLKGTVAGLVVQTNTGDLGVTPAIRLRGLTGSLNTAAKPLILLDNVEITDIMLVNPDDIENISVLKDAASSSIYGARAAWGVILITTKKGKKGDAKVTYSNNFGWNSPTSLPKMASTVDYSTMALQIHKRVDPSKTSLTSLGMSIDDTAIQKMKDWNAAYEGKDLGMEMELGRDFEVRGGLLFFYRPWDPIDMFMKEWTPQQTHNIGVSGGNDKTTYNISGAYLDQDGAIKVNPDKFTRANATININSQLKDWLSVRAIATMSKTNNKTPYSYTGATYDAWYYLLRWPAYYPYGTYQGKPFRSSITEYQQASSQEVSSMLNRISFGTTVNIMKGLTFDADYTYTGVNTHIYTPGGWAEGLDFWAGGGTFNYSRYTSASYNMVQYNSLWNNNNTVKAYATYINKIKDHSFKVILGSDIEAYENWSNLSKRNTLIDRYKPELALATGDQIVGGSHGHWSTAGYFGRINYDYKGKILLEANGRYDGSSRFPTNDQWAFFPSASVGYRLTEERFMDVLKPYLTSLKLRGSWGSIGNQDVGTGAFVPTMTTSNSNWIMTANLPTISSPKVVAPTLTWETVSTIDFGMDARFFNDKLGLVFDWYKRNVSDMLSAGVTLPTTFGATAPQRNFGEMQTKGWEVTVDFSHQFDNGLNINAMATLFDFQDEITKYANTTMNIYGNYEGKKLGEIWGYETDRYFQNNDFVTDGSGNLVLTNGKPTMLPTTPSQSIYEASWFFYGPGDIKYKDIKADGVINYGTNTVSDHGDLKVIGNETPRLQYSFRVGGDYKGFDLDLFFQGVGKREYWADGPVFINGWEYANMLYDHQLDYWTPENPDAFYPRPSYTSQSNNARNSLRQTKYLLDMSYLRLKNVTLGYTIPAKYTSKVKIERLRVYFSGENLVTFDNLYLPLDPETGMNPNYAAVGYGRSYPYSKTLSFGLQLSF
ncbi:MAG TPA: TonB-dependent receptor [Prolixibacteraceae bacterium]|nr:TonB-dependent receptor [Prolixibacteraceae bacterium]